jgi:hypothetical protein
MLSRRQVPSGGFAPVTIRRGRKVRATPREHKTQNPLPVKMIHRPSTKPPQLVSVRARVPRCGVRVVRRRRSVHHRRAGVRVGDQRGYRMGRHHFGPLQRVDPSGVPISRLPGRPAGAKRFVRVISYGSCDSQAIVSA